MTVRVLGQEPPDLAWTWLISVIETVSEIVGGKATPASVQEAICRKLRRKQERDRLSDLSIPWLECCLLTSRVRILSRQKASFRAALLLRTAWDRM
jgi:hypothetical protein